MSQGRECPLESELEDFAEILRTGDSNGLPVIVGGHAVGLWSRYFMAGGMTELANFLPFRSKDLDVVGTRDLLDTLHRRFQGKLSRSEPRSPVFGRLDIPQPGGGFIRVEVLHTVLGLDAKDLARTVNLDIEGVTGRLPLPHLILKAKLANAALIDQEGRQDVKHASMMLLCVRAFIMELSGKCRSKLLSERAMVNLLGEIWEIVNSPLAIKAARLWDLSLSGVWPHAELESTGNEKISRWLQHRFPQRPPTNL
jgi:hypothetical protein